jgi:hypothetical protein
MFLKKITVGGAAFALTLSGFGATAANAAPPNAPVINNYCTLSTNVPTSPKTDLVNAYITFGQGDCPSYIFDYSTGVWGDVAQPAAPAGNVLTRAALGSYLVDGHGQMGVARQVADADGNNPTGTPVDPFRTSNFNYNLVPSNFWPCGSLDCASPAYVDPSSGLSDNSNWNGSDRTAAPSGASIHLQNWRYDEQQIAGIYVPNSENTNNFAELYNAEKNQITRWTFTFASFVIKKDTSVAVTSAKKSKGKLVVKTRMDFGQGYEYCEVFSKQATVTSECSTYKRYFKSYAELYRDGKLIKTVKMNPVTGVAKFNVKAKKKSKHVYVVKSYFQDERLDTYKTAETTFTK